MALRLVLVALVLVTRTFFLPSTFSFKLRARLFFLKRAYASKMKKALEKNCLPDDLKEKLLGLYNEELDGLISVLSSAAEVAGLLKSPCTQRGLDLLTRDVRPRGFVKALDQMQLQGR